MKIYRLPKVFTEKWLTALRSGEYYQGKLYLGKSNRNCCLGVACIVAGIKPDYIESERLIHEDMLYLSQELPKELLAGYNLANRLVNLNDIGSSFLFIADWIENNVELY